MMINQRLQIRDETQSVLQNANWGLFSGQRILTEKFPSFKGQAELVKSIEVLLLIALSVSGNTENLCA